jgi:hypothetical protein
MISSHMCRFNRLSFMIAYFLCAFTGPVGCVSPQARMQSAEENQKEKDLDITTVGKITEPGNAGPQSLSGVGLVTGLSGTGHSPPASEAGRQECQGAFGFAGLRSGRGHRCDSAGSAPR